MGGIQGSLKFAGLAAYSSSKGAVITLSELLAEEYKERGISFNVLALGSSSDRNVGRGFSWLSGTNKSERNGGLHL
jgi:NAD(P)-dependent dehydrogenase (short-subunit alcohol dehydrogenase family)